MLCIRLYYPACTPCMYVHDSYRLLRKEICYISRKKLIERNKNSKISLFIGNIFHNTLFSFFLFRFFWGYLPVSSTCMFWYILICIIYFQAIRFLFFSDFICVWDCYVILWYKQYFLNANLFFFANRILLFELVHI